MNKEWNFRQIQNYIYEGPQITLPASPYFPHWRFVTMMLVGSASVPYKWSQTFKFVFCTSSHFRTVWKRKGRLSSVCSCIENGYMQICCPKGRGTLSAWSPGSYLVTKWCSKVVCIVIIWWSYIWCMVASTSLIHICGQERNFVSGYKYCPHSTQVPSGVH